MKQHLLILLSFFAIGYQSLAQEGVPVYFDYLADNYYLVYPSMAGIGEGGKIRATIRKQWFSVDEAPNLQTLNAHARVGESSGFGAIFFNDANGYHSQTGLKLTYAHHLRLGGDYRSLNQLSFGLSAGIQQSNLDESEFVSVIPDPIVTGSRNSVSYFNMDLGMSYNFMEFYAHAAIHNLMGRGRDLYSAIESNNLRKYLISTGYVFGRSEWQLEPSVLFQYTEFTQEKAIDINAKVYKSVDFGTVWGGLSYRRSFDGAQYQTATDFGEQRLQLITPIVGVNYRNFLVSYNYSYQMGDVRFDNGGFHQITLGYDFGQSEKRYDCKCPAVNY
ncbi:type IX secretion system membrane protein PorP/SprF [Arenibacter sp. TNZ]|jgi:type IX secretion system PorP/SprF family membrane protein|uniref:PorP/SprF family type IX secretion system membrane protein n=1 Tax=Arenibacter TaxID=178469 RepID=UPI000CD3F5F5|nr:MULTISPECIES: type IX secretion system membrane protein PorP/SprF [Arenibacter]MCM4173584.1 type IX secretion system membrane protein PorP/SprF [Arenibacter sp. TNZ]